MGISRGGVFVIAIKVGFNPTNGNQTLNALLGFFRIGKKNKVETPKNEVYTMEKYIVYNRPNFLWWDFYTVNYMFFWNMMELFCGLQFVGSVLDSAFGKIL